MWTSYKRLFNGTNVNLIFCIAHKSYYEVLNVPKTATHKEVKDAYYRLSMLYHPDKNKGSEEAAKIFCDITSAYEVLGNVRQRRLYDSNNTIKKTSQYKPNYRTSTHNYNFDKWSKAHYSSLYQKHQFNKEAFLHKKMNEEHVSQLRTYNLLLIMIFISLFIIVSIYQHIKMIKKQRENIKNFSERND